MADWRIREHPILPVPEAGTVPFIWKGNPLEARAGETIASALFANGVRIFGRHPKDGAAQGIFCANGQCAQCTVMADGLPVKSCMVPVAAGMRVEPVEGRPALPEIATHSSSGDGDLAIHPIETVEPIQPIETIEVECLILGGGPAGLSAAIELGKAGVRTLVVDDKHRLGGKLVLQTHKFFGSIEACHAGTRGIDIASRLERELQSFENVRIWLNSTGLAVFSDRRVGILREGRYVIVQPQILLVATGARERSLVFPGNTLPGVYGAGAFQTLVNRDLVRPTERLFIVGGGNDGLIAGYHALQAGIAVVGLCEALPDCGGYKVHKDKLVRMGVPIYTSHTVLSANGKDEVESVTIARIDDSWKPVPGTEQTFVCDTLLVAVGLDPVDEFLHKAKEFGLPVYASGDAEEIAEASAAMFTGRIRGLEIARALGRDVGEVPPEWHRTAEVLKSKPGATVTEDIPEGESGVFPVFHCAQEIPCNPCTSICPEHSIVIEGDDIMGLPEFRGDKCIACEQCVAVCPGLALTLVDFRARKESPSDEAIVTIPYEFASTEVRAGETVTVLDTEGAILGNVEVVKVRAPKFADRARLVRVKAPREIAKRIAGIRVQDPWVTQAVEEEAAAEAARPIADDEIVCRCERVTAADIRRLIRAGARDVNEIKAATRACMGACGGKTCPNLILRIFREEGIAAREVTVNTHRPLFMEVPLGAFAGVSTGAGPAKEARVSHATDALEGCLLYTSPSPRDSAVYLV
ncbi:MAG: FAD-dependent oxidoreductase, partial [Candidatus Eisenbacteria bacterium]|nr:FAD-dependent oxidoreductase [Candidatus Eisenbacteria bacterium]